MLLTILMTMIQKKKTAQIEYQIHVSESEKECNLASREENFGYVENDDVEYFIGKDKNTMWYKETFDATNARKKNLVKKSCIKS